MGLHATDAELIRCRDCRVWDPENQPSVMAKLRDNPDAYANRQFMLVKNGMYLTGPFGQIPLHTELILCEAHEVQ